MKVSIITVCYNSEDTIRDTIVSVINQTYDQIEYIIVDGKSTDRTMDIVNSYREQIAQVVSEPDQGMYDACNKGIQMATGDIVAILNSDDVYANIHIIQNVVDHFQQYDCDTLYGDLQYVEANDMSRVARHWVSGGFKKRKFLFGWMPPHPTFFVKREVYQKYGVFKTNFKSAADYELMLRFLFKHQVKAGYLPEVMVLMRQGGMSNANLTNRIRANQEDQMAWVSNGLQSYAFTLWLKPIRKIPQFLFSKLYRGKSALAMAGQQQLAKQNLAKRKGHYLRILERASIVIFP